MSNVNSIQTRSRWNRKNMSYRDDGYSPSRGASIFELCPQLAALDPAVAHTYMDDFNAYDATATVGNWAEVVDAGATIALADTAGGVLSAEPDSDDNDEFIISSIAENWLFAADKPLWFECRCSLNDDATNTHAIAVGLADHAGADLIVDGGLSPAASYDGALFFKAKGGAVWQFESSNAATQDTEADVGDFSDDTMQRLGFIFDPADGTTGTITPYVDGVAGTAVNITLAGLEEMHIVFSVKDGAGTTAPLLIDYVKVVQIR